MYKVAFKIHFFSVSDLLLRFLLVFNYVEYKVDIGIKITFSFYCHHLYKHICYVVKTPHIDGANQQSHTCFPLRTKSSIIAAACQKPFF